MARRPPAVARVLTRVTATIREHEQIAPGDLVLVAVSGGPDTCASCMRSRSSGASSGCGSRSSTSTIGCARTSGSDTTYVRRIGDRLGLDVHVRTAEGTPAKGESVEAWATGQRGNAANDVRCEIGAASTAEGHTLDDQAETVLLNLVRGTGIEGLAGIDPGGAGAPNIQPLLDVTREEVEAFCRSLHLRPRRDPMNEDRRFSAPRSDMTCCRCWKRPRDAGSRPRSPGRPTRSEDRDELWRNTDRVYFQSRVGVG